MRPYFIFITGVVILLSILFIIFSLSKALADDGPPSTPPTPGPVVNTGGNVSGSSPGSSCVPRLGLRAPSYVPSGTYNWAQNGDAGWPFGWPGLSLLTPQTTPPIVGCSR